MSARSLSLFLFISLVTVTGLAQPMYRGGSAPPTLVDWPFFAFSVSGGSYNPLETTLTTQNVSTLTMKFQYATRAKVSFAPIIANGVAYYSAGDGTFNAVNATTGALLWEKTAGAPGPACYANGVLYLSLGLHMYALDAATGRASGSSHSPTPSPWHL